MYATILLKIYSKKKGQTLMSVDNTQNKLYMNMGVYKNAEVQVLGRTVETPFSSMADGLIGAVYVFDTEENAKKFDPTQKVVKLNALENK